MYVTGPRSVPCLSTCFMNFPGDDSASDTESLHQLTINEHYAKAFQYKKEREELSKCKILWRQTHEFSSYTNLLPVVKEKYGSDYEEADGDEDEDESDSESEDEDGEALTPAVDAAILRTLSRIQKKDPAIYDGNQSVFDGTPPASYSPTMPTMLTNRVYVDEAKHTAASTPWGYRAPRDKVCSANSGRNVLAISASSSVETLYSATTKSSIATGSLVNVSWTTSADSCGGTTGTPRRNYQCLPLGSFRR